MQELQVGSVVKSLKGHDKDKFFVVIEVVSDKYVRIADGKTRKISTPKLKKIKHLESNGEILEKVQQIISQKVPLYDKIIKISLKKYYNQNGGNNFGKKR